MKFAWAKIQNNEKSCDESPHKKKRKEKKIEQQNELNWVFVAQNTKRSLMRQKNVLLSIKLKIAHYLRFGLNTKY